MSTFSMVLPDAIDDKLTALTVLLKTDRANVTVLAYKLLWEAVMADEVYMAKDGFLQRRKIIVK